MKLETLYKRTKTGAIQYYQVWVENLDSITIFKESGQLGTKSPIVHKECITQGKNIGKANETTSRQQAESQAQSDWQRKKDEGYKSLTDLNATVVQAANNASIDSVEMSNANLEKCLQQWLPQFNTDASGNVKPMLATDWNKIKSVKYPVYIQPKLDGVRCLTIIDTDKVVSLSRNGKEYDTLNHIHLDLMKLWGDKSLSFPIILDGEIYSDILSFQEIVAATKKLTVDSLQLKYRVYDIAANLAQDLRLNMLTDIVTTLDSQFVQLVDTTLAHNREDVIKAHDAFVQQGYEGAMLRYIEGAYGFGQRSRELLKVKEFDETEFDFICFTVGQREEDLLALCHTKDGKQFSAKMMGSKEYKAKLLEQNPEKLEDLQITIKHFKYTNDGLPRFPIGKSLRNYE